ncbi:MAG: c-type cytochrome domain-containing protein [Planctomycetota bacterium]
MTKLLKFNNGAGRQAKLQAMPLQLLASLLLVSLAGSAYVSAQEPAQSTTPSWTPQQLEFFESKIRPVLAEKCYKCHSESSDKLGGGLRVDTRAGLLEGGDSGPALEPGKPRDSLCFRPFSTKTTTMPCRRARLAASWPTT